MISAQKASRAATVAEKPDASHTYAAAARDDTMLESETIFVAKRTARKTISGRKKHHALEPPTTVKPKRKPYSAATALPPRKCANTG